MFSILLVLLIIVAVFMTGIIFYMACDNLFCFVRGIGNCVVKNRR